MVRGRRTPEEVASIEGMGLAIKKLRDTEGISRSGLARKADIGSSTLRDIERGASEAKWGTLRRLASALQIPLDALVEMAEELAPDVGRQARRETLDRSA